MTEKVLNCSTLLLGMGSAKAGTSWLGDYLRNHPQVFVSPIKEMHYFSQLEGLQDYETIWTKALKRKKKLLAKYVAHTTDSEKEISASEKAQAVEAHLMRYPMLNSTWDDHSDYYNYFNTLGADSQVFADITPAYSLLSLEAMRKARSVHADVRALFLMRDPVSRFFSQLLMGEQNNNDKIVSAVGSFARALARPERTARGRYEQIIPKIEAAFKPNETCYVYYEELFSDTQIKKICEFLNIDFVPGDYSKRVNSADQPTPLPPNLAQLAFEEFVGTYEYCEQRFGYIPEKWKGYS